MDGKKFGDDFHQLFKHLFTIWTITDEMKKLRSGFLLKEILDRFSRKLERTLNPDRSFWLYFAMLIYVTFTNFLKFFFSENIFISLSVLAID